MVLMSISLSTRSILMSSISNSYDRKGREEIFSSLFLKMKRKVAIIAALLACMLTGCADSQNADTLFSKGEDSYVGDVMALSEENVMIYGK